MNLRQTSPGVFVTDESIVCLSGDVIAFLKKEALASPRKRVRVCAHKSKDDQVHEMIIALAKDSYVRPHGHLAKSESFHVMEGLAQIALFDDQGEITHFIPLGDIHSGRSFYYRIADPRYHTVIVESDFLVFHETTGGPFSPEQTRYPDWAPTEDRADEARQYIAKLRERIR
ncbi:MAG TPA: cupin fold metalloprotein, WbuC family [Verrucomicrobia bacterium]|nr:MAG: hypothetical protein A2X46_18525 [Lentisphaerae bacterium GWF2_57_35]HBA84536.1 cupin fold metalloprotein, WbuC family [Verrucomicrobiota bacterium]